MYNSHTRTHAHTEIEAVASVVFYNQQAPRRAGQGLDGAKHRRGGRRSKDPAQHSSRQHALADEASVRGLVATATAADQDDLLRADAGVVGAREHVLWVPADTAQVARARECAL